MKHKSPIQKYNEKNMQFRECEQCCYLRKLSEMNSYAVLYFLSSGHGHSFGKVHVFVSGAWQQHINAVILIVSLK